MRRQMIRRAGERNALPREVLRRARAFLRDAPRLVVRAGCAERCAICMAHHVFRTARLPPARGASPSAWRTMFSARRVCRMACTPPARDVSPPAWRACRLRGVACPLHDVHATCTGCFATCMACLPSERGCLSSAWRACRCAGCFAVRMACHVLCMMHRRFCVPDRLLIMDWFHVLCMTRPPLARRSLSSAPSFRSPVHIIWRLSAAAVILRGARA